MTKKLAITCLHKRVQDTLVKAVRDSGGDDTLIGLIGKLSPCESGALVEFNKRKGSSSAYSMFASECMKADKGPVTERMQRCAAKWREKKGK